MQTISITNKCRHQHYYHNCVVLVQPSKTTLIPVIFATTITDILINIYGIKQPPLCESSTLPMVVYQLVGCKCVCLLDMHVFIFIVMYLFYTIAVHALLLLTNYIHTNQKLAHISVDILNLIGHIMLPDKSFAFQFKHAYFIGNITFSFTTVFWNIVNHHHHHRHPSTTTNTAAQVASAMEFEM